MKKIAFVIIFISYAGMLVAASNEVMADPGNPKKEQEKQVTFSLAKGYFSFFNLFSSSHAQPDSSRKLLPVILEKQLPVKKS